MIKKKKKNCDKDAETKHQRKYFQCFSDDLHLFPFWRGSVGVCCLETLAPLRENVEVKFKKDPCWLGVEIFEKTINLPDQPSPFIR